MRRFTRGFLVPFLLLAIPLGILASLGYLAAHRQLARARDAAYRAACADGEAWACYLRANLELPTDPVAALSQYEEACAGGFQLGCFQAAEMQWNADGVPANRAGALQLLSRMCKDRLTDACVQLDFLCATGSRDACRP